LSAHTHSHSGQRNTLQGNYQGRLIVAMVVDANIVKASGASAFAALYRRDDLGVNPAFAWLPVSTNFPSLTRAGYQDVIPGPG
jgi:hypothetical protein